MKTKINFKKLHQADLFINSSVMELSQEDDRAFSEFLRNKKREKDLVNVRQKRLKMKTSIQIPTKEPLSVNKKITYNSLEEAFEAKHQKANEFIKKVKLTF